MAMDVAPCLRVDEGYLVGRNSYYVAIFPVNINDTLMRPAGPCGNVLGYPGCGVELWAWELGERMEVGPVDCSCDPTDGQLDSRQDSIVA